MAGYEATPDGEKRAPWEAVARGVESTSVRTPETAAKVLQVLKNGQPGMGHAILLSTKNHIVAIKRFGVAADTAALDIARDLSLEVGRHGAAAVIFDLPLPEAAAARLAGQLAKYGKAIELQVLDVLDANQKSMRESGLANFTDPGPPSFSSETPGTYEAGGAVRETTEDEAYRAGPNADRAYDEHIAETMRALRYARGSGAARAAIKPVSTHRFATRKPALMRRCRESRSARC